MPHLLVVTFTGPDRPGIVEKLSGLVTRHGGNWEESRMASLAGRFAGILKVTVPDAQAYEYYDPDTRGNGGAARLEVVEV